jgi:tetratricopeptide (TPR) repeat protein
MSASGFTSLFTSRFTRLLAITVLFVPTAGFAQSASQDNPSASAWDRISPSPINDNVVSVEELRSPGKAQKAFNKGAKLLLKGDAAGSIAYFDRAIAKDPSYYRAYYDKGLAHFRLGQAAEAEQAFQKTIDLTAAGYAPADFLMGMILCQTRQFRWAEMVLQKGLELDPGSAIGKVLLGWTQFALNRPAEAERSAQQALLRKANLPEAYFLLAQIHHTQHNSSAVVADLQAYFRLDPNGPESSDARALLATAQQEMN